MLDLCDGATSVATASASLRVSESDVEQAATVLVALGLARQPGMSRRVALQRAALVGTGVVAASLVAPYAAAAGSPGPVRGGTYSQAVLASGPVAYYLLDDPTGATTAADASGHGHAATYSSAKTAADTTTPGATSDSPAAFQGGGNFATTPTNLVSNALSLEFWVRTGGDPSTENGEQWYNGKGLVDAEQSSITNDFGSSILHGSNVAFGIGAGDTTLQSGPIDDGHYHYVVGTWDSSTGAQVLYIDGALFAQTTTSTQPRNPNVGIALGRIQTNENGLFGGALDQVAIYNRALTAAEVTAHYAAR